MKLVSQNSPEKNVIELEIQVSGQEFEAAIEKAYKKNVSKIQIQGFRKGKAPRKFIEKIYGKEFFYEDAVNAVYPEAYDKAVTEAGIQPVDRASIEVKEVNENGFTFVAKVTVMPEVTVKNYKGIKAELETVKVEAAEVQAEIDRLLEKNSRQVAVSDRPVKDGDIVIIDYSGSLNGEKFDGGTAEKQTLKIGSKQFIPGFEEQIIGHNIGDEFDIEVTFPEDYNAEELAGKKTVFAIKLHEIKFNEKPELDDEFVKDISAELNTVEELKKDIKDKILTGKKNSAEKAMEESLMDTLVEGMQADIPEVMFERELLDIQRDYDFNLRQQGMDFNTYLQLTGTDLEGFNKLFRPQAERRLKTRLALMAVAKAEKFVFSDEEVEAEYDRMSKAYNTQIDKIKAAVSPEDIMMDLSLAKAVEFVKNNAEIKEVAKKAEKAAPKKAAEKKPAAKKPAAKKPAAKKESK